MASPCEKCKRAECPVPCYPLEDYKRGQRKKGLTVVRGRVTSPCYKCEQRYPGCHGKCAGYNEWKEYIDRGKGSWPSDGDADGYEANRTMKQRAYRRRVNNGKSK